MSSMGRCAGKLLCVARPNTMKDVVDIVGICGAAGVSIVSRGGGTGRSGGAVPAGDEPAVILSLERLRRIRSVDPIGNVIVAEAGCTLHEIQEAAREIGRTIGLDHGGAGTSQLGGNLATNAGGNTVIRYGMTRDQVLGVEAVLADGSVIGPAHQLYKNNTGYDLRHLLVGSEGTLGVITAASLKMRPLPVASATAMLALETPGQALDLLVLAREHLGESISALELMSRSALDLPGSAAERIGSTTPAPWTALLECHSTSRFFRLEDAYAGLLEEAMNRGIVSDGSLASSIAHQRAMWARREGIPAAMAAENMPMVKTDTAVPIAAVPAFIALVEARASAAAPGNRTIFFGHVGDGNIHVNLLPPRGGDLAAFTGLMPQLHRIVEDAALSLGGTVSAEHGIGQTKREALLRMKSDVELGLMRAIRDTFDPHHLFNPGKIIAEVPGASISRDVRRSPLQV